MWIINLENIVYNTYKFYNNEDERLYLQYRFTLISYNLKIRNLNFFTHKSRFAFFSVFYVFCDCFLGKLK